MLVAVGLIFEADLKGTVFERNSVGGLSADPLLLSTPILFALAATLVILRFLPYIYRFFAWLTYDRFPLSIASTLRYVSRTVGPAARLTILLMLGAALGTFAASYADTVELSLAERIEYDNGVEFRVELNDSGYSSAAGIRNRLGPIEGVEGIAAVHRSKVSAGRSIGTSSSVELLGIEPRAAVEMMWFREDLSLLSFEELIATIDVPPVGRGVSIPPETQTASRLAAHGRGGVGPVALVPDPRRRRSVPHRRRTADAAAGDPLDGDGDRFPDRDRRFGRQRAVLVARDRHE